MNFERLEIPEIVKISPVRLGDSRGYFSEVFKEDEFVRNIGNFHFVQDNQSFSSAVGTVRGLHFQLEPAAQGKLVRVLTGAIFDVAVDIRAGSPTFGKWVGATLSSDNGQQLWVPPGFAHGFATIEPDTTIHYKVTSHYSALHDRGVMWSDPVIGVEWPVMPGMEVLSEKDRRQPLLSDLPVTFIY